MFCLGTVQNGVVVLDQQTVIADGTKARVEPMMSSTEIAAMDDADLGPIFRMDELAIDTGIPDLATNHNHYLYGHPR